jgi:phosphatidate cytidylyltransferase
VSLFLCTFGQKFLQRESSMKNIILRSISGAVYVALIVGCILLGNYAFLALGIILTALGLIELFKLNHASEPHCNILPCFLDVISGVIMVTGAWCLFIENCATGVNISCAAYLLVFLVRLVSQLYIKESTSLSTLMSSLFGQMYIAFPLSLMMAMYAQSHEMVLVMFIFIWLNDTGAFIVGSSIGRKPLFQRLSPKKSWEGFWGGMLFCIAAAIIIECLWPEFIGTLSVATAIGMAIITSVFSTWGDLMESMIKRTLNVKDSGKLIPGHGGILDRIDSLLFVIPALICYLLIVN